MKLGQKRWAKHPPLLAEIPPTWKLWKKGFWENSLPSLENAQVKLINSKYQHIFGRFTCHPCVRRPLLPTNAVTKELEFIKQIKFFRLQLILYSLYKLTMSLLSFDCTGQGLLF